VIENEKEGTMYFELTAENAMRFFQLCQERKADTLEERLKILAELAEEHKVNRIGFCQKTQEEFIDHLKQEHNILYINEKDKPDAQKD
jgi:hypothetical protein